MRLKRDKPGDALGRPSWQSSLLRDPGAKFLPQSGGKHEKYNLERMSTSITVQESEFEWPVLNRPQMAGFGVTTEAISLSVRGLPCGVPNKSSAVRMCIAVRIDAMIPITRFRPSSITSIVHLSPCIRQREVLFYLYEAIFCLCDAHL
jgi:hypothetical protein